MHKDTRRWSRRSARMGQGVGPVRNRLLILALGCFAVSLVPAPALAMQYGPYECAEFGPGRTCWGWGGSAGPTSGSERRLWNHYCRTGADGGTGRVDHGTFPPDRTDLSPEQLEGAGGNFVRVNDVTLSALWIELYKLNPTGTYVRVNVDCWDADAPTPGYDDGLPAFTAEEAVWRVGTVDPSFWIIATTPPRDPEEWRDEVAALLRVDPPPAQMAPEPGLQAVNVASWIWLPDSYAPVDGITRTSTLGVAQLTIVARAQELTFDPGTGAGDAVSCPVDSPAWAPGADESTGCTYTYRIPSAFATMFPATASVTWEYSWTFGTPERTFVDNEVFFAIPASALIPTAVDELQILETE
jgi:hypothetical protein